MNPYSCDLRAKIVTLYEQGAGSIRQLAKRFQVSPDCVRRLLNHDRAHGQVAPLPYRRGPKPRLKRAHDEVLKALVEADNDATLNDLARRLKQATGVEVSASTISRALSRLNLSRKKRVSKPVKYTVSRNKLNDTPSGRSCETSIRSISCF